MRINKNKISDKIEKPKFLFHQRREKKYKTSS